MKIDLVVVFSTFRQCGVYLPVVKELINNYKVGVYVCQLDDSNSKKTINDNDRFLELLYSYGVKDITDSDVICNITILPQWRFFKHDVDKIYRNIVSDKRFWMVSLALGNKVYGHLNNLKIDKVLVIDKEFYKYRLSKRPKEKDINITFTTFI